MSSLDFEGILEIALRTLSVCGSALVIASLIGIPLGIALGSRRFKGRGLIVSTVNAGMGAPPVVIGLLSATLLWRSGLLGDLNLMYTRTAMILAQVLLAIPLITGITLAAVGSLDEEWSLQVETLGIGRGWRLWLLVREIRMGLLAAVIAGLGGIISEVGAVQMVGGNIAGETRVLTTAIMMHTNMGEFEFAQGLGVILFGITLLIAGLLTSAQQSGQRR